MVEIGIRVRIRVRVTNRLGQLGSATRYFVVVRGT